MRFTPTRPLATLAAAALALLVAGAVFAQDAAPDVNVDAKGKELAQKVCTIFMGGDRAGFEAMLHSSLNKSQNMRYWWDVSGKGSEYTKLYSDCQLARVDKTSTPERIKVFIQRTPKRPGTSMPAPVSFQPDAKAGGEYKITACSI